LPPSLLMINSPYNREAHYAKKGTTSWVGYKVHLTESCEEGLSHWITHVETTAAPIADGDATDRIHRALQQDLLPSLHLVDTGYSDAGLLVSSRQEYGVKLLGPTRADQHWQAKADQGFEAHRFRIDWEHKQATCPEGHTSASWTPALNRSRNPVIQIKFATADCGPCPRRSQCTHSTRARRTLTLLPRDQYLALEQAPQRQADDHFAQQYAQPAGIEGTLSQAVRAFELRRARYIGQAKTHLQHLATAAALNLVRVGMWLIGQPQAQTRHSSFVRLMAQPAPP
jgi:transposase